MKISWNEVSHYFEEPLPKPLELVERITASFCEIEGIENLEGDYLLDVKILPDRPDAKNAAGFARELSAIMGWSVLSGTSVIADATTARITIDFIPSNLNDILGLSLSDAEISSFLNRVRVGVVGGKAYIPSDRIDLNLVEDLADEVMRLYGVERIPSTALPSLSNQPSSPFFEAVEKVRVLLASAGYTEIYAYSFAPEGEREVEKSLASHKSFLRTNLSDNLKEKLQWNLQFNLFEYDPVKLFEVGTVFSGGKEELHLSVGIAYAKEKYKKESLPAWLGAGDSPVYEVPLVQLLPTLEKIDTPDATPYLNLDKTFKPFSLYPRIVRDIALFVPVGVTADEVATVIRENAGPLLVEGPVKFDEYSKEGEERTSLAFRIAFQSHKKSLTDDEAHTALSGIISALEKHPSWEVRK